MHLGAITVSNLDLASHNANDVTNEYTTQTYAATSTLMLTGGPKTALLRRVVQSTSERRCMQKGQTQVYAIA